MKSYTKKRYILAGLLLAGISQNANAGSIPVQPNPALNKFQAAGNAIIAKNKLQQPLAQKPGMPQAPVATAAAAIVPVAAPAPVKLPPFTAAEGAKKMKESLGEPGIFDPRKGNCSAPYGNVKWAGVKELVNRGFSTQVDTHFTNNASGCNPVKDKNFMDAMQKSCEAAKDVTGLPIKDQYCGVATKAAEIKANTIATTQAAAKDNALFPSGPTMIFFNEGKQCPQSAAKMLNVPGLSEYYKRHAATASNAQFTAAQQNMGKAAIANGDKYLANLQKCAISKSDPNFNSALSTVFGGDKVVPVVADGLKTTTCQAYVAAQANGAPKKFVEKLQNLCVASKNTGTVIAQANQVADIKKAFNVPETPLGYVNLSKSLTTPLTAADAAQKVADWSRLDQASFDKHFDSLWDGLTTKPGKIVNPEATNMMVTACNGSLASVTNPKVVRVCEAAKLTGNANATVQIKAALGATGAKFNCKVANKINPISVQRLLEVNPAEGQAYITNVTNCLQNSTDPILTSHFVTTCQSGLSITPEAKELCALADQKNAEHAAANAAAAGFDPNATLGGEAPADPSAAGYDPNAALGGEAPADASAAGFDPNAALGGETPADASATGYDPNAALGGEAPADASATGFDPNALPTEPSAEVIDQSATGEFTGLEGFDPSI